MTEILLDMLDELENSRLTVIKIRSRLGEWIRYVESCNCEWYQRFCSNHMKRQRRRYRKVRTFIKRRNTIRALNRMIVRGDMSTTYARRIIDFVSTMKRNN